MENANLTLDERASILRTVVDEELRALADGPRTAAGAELLAELIRAEAELGSIIETSGRADDAAFDELRAELYQRERETLLPLLIEAESVVDAAGDLPAGFLSDPASRTVELARRIDRLGRRCAGIDATLPPGIRSTVTLDESGAA